jgi:hypothetical protein
MTVKDVVDRFNNKDTPKNEQQIFIEIIEGMNTHHFAQFLNNLKWLANDDFTLKQLRDGTYKAYVEPSLKAKKI